MPPTGEASETHENIHHIFFSCCSSRITGQCHGLNINCFLTVWTKKWLHYVLWLFKASLFYSSYFNTYLWCSLYFKAKEKIDEEQQGRVLNQMLNQATFLCMCSAKKVSTLYATVVAAVTFGGKSGPAHTCSCYLGEITP